MAARCSKPVVHAVGEIAIAFGNLELFLAVTIWQLLGVADKVVEQLAQAITAEMSFDRKVHALASMYKIRFPADAASAEFEQLLARLFEAQNLRNQVLHSSWPVPGDDGEIIRIKSSAKSRKGLRNRATVVRAKDIVDVVALIHDVGHDLARLGLDKIQKRMPSPVTVRT